MVTFTVRRFFGEAFQVPVRVVTVCDVIRRTCQYQIIVIECGFCFPVTDEGTLLITDTRKDRTQCAGPGIGRAAEMQSRRTRMSPCNVKMVVTGIC